MNEDITKLKGLVQLLRAINPEEARSYEAAIQELENKISQQQTTGRRRRTTGGTEISIGDEELQKVILRLAKQKISDFEVDYPLETFLYRLFHQKEKLQLKKIEKILKDVEYVGHSLGLILGRSRNKKLKKYSDRLTRLYSKIIYKEGVIKHFDKNIDVSVKWAKSLYLSNLDINKRYLTFFKLKADDLKDYLKDPKKDLNRSNFEGKKQYNNRVRIIKYWKHLYKVYKELNKDIVSIINLVKEMKEDLSTIAERSEEAPAGGPSTESEGEE